nr:unnamed protein product [Callosobruchus analis]
MSAEEETLVGLVSKYESLYDMSNKNYSNSEMKDNIWQQIGEQMNWSGYCQRIALELKQDSQVEYTISRTVVSPKRYVNAIDLNESPVAKNLKKTFIFQLQNVRTSGKN